MGYQPVIPYKKKKWTEYISPSYDEWYGGESSVAPATGSFLVDESDNPIVDENNDNIVWE